MPMTQARKRTEKLQLYSTYIRQVNEFVGTPKREKHAIIKHIAPAKANHAEKYRKYLELVDEENGVFPRVSELSRHLEQE